MTTSVTEKATTSSAGNNSACSDRRGGKDKYGSGKRTETGDRSSQKRPLCNGGGQKKELLCLQRIWAHGPTL